MATSTRIIATCTLALAALFQSACVTQSESMQVTEPGFTAQSLGSVCVQVGDNQGGAAVMEVSDKELREAIEASVSSVGLFSPVLEQPDGADYLLYAALVRKDQALVSLSSDTGVEIYWRLINLRTQRVIWSEDITTRASGGVAGLAGNNRTAGAGHAISQNIRQALETIHYLGLK